LFLTSAASYTTRTPTLHDALPIPARAIDHVHALDRGDQLVDGIGQEADLSVAHDLGNGAAWAGHHRRPARERLDHRQPERLGPVDRKSTRLNSSHQIISYAGCCAE